MDKMLPLLLETTLEKLNMEMDLKSWTISQQNNQDTQIIIRFRKIDPTPSRINKTGKFVKKSMFHKKRDQERITNFNRIKSDEFEKSEDMGKFSSISNTEQTVGKPPCTSDVFSPSCSDHKSEEASSTVIAGLPEPPKAQHNPSVSRPAQVPSDKPRPKSLKSRINALSTSLSTKSKAKEKDLISYPVNSSVRPLRDPYEFRTRPASVSNVVLQPSKSWRRNNLDNSSNSD